MGRDQSSNTPLTSGSGSANPAKPPITSTRYVYSRLISCVLSTPTARLIWGARQHGESTDPPPATTPHSAKRYGRLVERPTETPPAKETDVFCATCLKHQALVSQTLANYLPAPEDPSYDEYLAQEDDYRRSLEERYPPVCANCEGRVKARISKASYDARADHLRRIMERGKDARSETATWEWRWRAAWAGAALWGLALAGFLLWHALGATTNGEREMRDDGPAPSLASCWQLAYGAWRIESRCAEAFRPFIGWLLLLALAALWWNPVMARRTMTRVGGLDDYYRLQAVLFLARAACWYVLREDSGYDFDPSVEQAVHAVMLVVNVVASLS